MYRNLRTIIICCPIVLFGQIPKMEFEVATIKPTGPQTRGESIQLPGKRFEVTGMTLTSLVSFAYQVPRSDIAGGPPWMNSARFDIVAQVESRDSQLRLEHHRLRLQNLLAERFHLQFHREKKERAGYALVLDGNGPKLKKVLASNASEDGQPMKMGGFATFLSQQVGTPVLDRTGDDGTYYVKLIWTSDDGEQRSLGVRSNASKSPGGPSIFTAVRELGLRLQSQKVPVEVFVIDGAMKPSEN